MSDDCACVAKVQFVCIGVQLTRTTGHDFALNALPQAPYSITAEALNSWPDLGLNVPLKKNPKARGGGNPPKTNKKLTKKLTKNEKNPKSLLLITDLTMDTVYFY